MSNPALQYLDFDFSEDEHGLGSFDAMASVLPAQLPALQAEIARVLDWAQGSFTRGALDDGFDWDYDLQLAAEQVGPSLRHTASLTLGGVAPFCLALREAFGLDC
jgi:hypothetical protein